MKELEREQLENVVKMARKMAGTLRELSKSDSVEEKRRTGEVGELFPPSFFEQFSEESASAVNRFFGMETVGPLDFHNLPQRISLGKLWRENSPILKRYPLGRELYTGRDLVNGELSITEITVGKQRKELAVEDAELAKKGIYKTPRLGGVSHQSHLFSFHTHVLGPDEVLPEDRRERIVQNTPGSSYADFAWFVLDPKSYVQTVLDISLWGKVIVGQALVAIKTTASWHTERDIYLDKEWELTREMFFADQLNLHQSEFCKMPGQVNSSSQKMILRLQSDGHWSNLTGVAIYRGLVLDTNKDSSAYRWDVFYRRLMAMERKTERKRKKI